MHAFRLPITAVAVLLAGCAKDAPKSTDFVISEVDTLVPGTPAQFNRPADLAFSRDGKLYVTDVASSQILVFDTTGKAIDVFGREGGGPGEFLRPRSLIFMQDTVVILDGGNSRLQFLNADGGYLASTPVVASAAASLSPRGQLLVSTNSQEGTRAVLKNFKGEVLGKFGTPVAELPENDFQEMKRQIQAGEVPPGLKAITLPVLGPNGDVWLIGVAEANVERFSPDGTSRWTMSFADLPEAGQIKARFFELNQADSNANRFFPLDHVVSARPVRENLLMLLRMPEDQGAQLLLLSPEGTIRAQIRIPEARGVRSFAIDEVTEWLYLMDFYGGTLMRVHLPEDLNLEG